jgi:hypothetical protein
MRVLTLITRLVFRARLCLVCVGTFLYRFRIKLFGS